MKRCVLLFGAIGVTIAAPAFADDLTVSANTAAAVATLSAANGTPGNITIASTGSVSISTAGAAVSLNSNNFISNSGTILNSAATSAVGVQITAGNTGSFTNKGVINIPGNGTSTSAGQIGVILSGSGAFTGDIVTTTGSSVTLAGISADALALQSELNGNLNLGGTINATGSGANGVVIGGPIDGAFVNTGTITTGRGTGAANTVLPGNAIAIGSSVAGGFLNAGPVNSADTTAAAVVAEVGATPAMIVGPSIALDVADLTLGTASDAKAPGNSIINRGKITATGDVPGISATTIQIGNTSDNTSGKKTIFSGGFYNSGTVSSVATSDAPNVLTAAASATTFIIGNGASIPLLTNAASGTISATTSGTLGGNTTAMVIQTGGSLAALNNAGIITSSANATNTAVATLTAYAIHDATGTLTHVTNSGTISATATLLAAGTQKAVAADLSAATLPTVFTNTGIVTGDVLFGASNANQLSIEGANAIVAGQVQAFHGGTVNIAVSGGGTGGILQTPHVAGVGTLTVGPGGTLNLEVGANAPVVSATGAISLDAASHLVLTPISILPSTNALTLIHSDTSLSFGNFAATTGNVQVPFLFTGSLSPDAKNLTLNLQRKTASQLGFTGNAAAIYEPALDAALNDSVLGSALSGLETAAEVQTAVEQLLPIASGAALAATETITDSNMDAVGTRQRTLLLAPGAAAGFSIWGQGLYGLFHGSDQDSYSGHGAGGVVGFDFAQPGSGHFGIALTVFTAHLDEKSPLTAKTEAQTYLLSPYMGFRIQNFFIDAQLNAGESNLKTDRTVNVGSLTRVASGKPDEMLASGGISGGYVLNLGFIQLVPQASLNGIELFDHAYTESGGGAGVDLTVNSHNQSSLRGFLGLAAGGAYDTGGARLVPQVLAGWSQELVTGSTTVDAAFASVSQSNFEVSGPVANRSHLTAGAGFDFVGADWSVGLKYSAAITSSALSQTAGLTMSARF